MYDDYFTGAIMMDFEDQKLEQAINILNETRNGLRSYKATTEEIYRCYSNCHQDSWEFEQALRRIANMSLYDYENVGESSVTEQRDIAVEALEKVWKRREERYK